MAAEGQDHNHHHHHTSSGPHVDRLSVMRWLPSVAGAVAVLISVGTLFWSLSAKMQAQQLSVEWHERRITALEATFQDMKKDLFSEQRMSDQKLSELNRKLDVIIATQVTRITAPPEK